MATSSVPSPSLSLRPPAGFVAVPLDPEPNIRQRHGRELAERMHAVTSLAIDELSQALSAVGERLIAMHIRLLGSFPVPSGAVANLVLAIPELRTATPEVIARDPSFAISALAEFVQRRTPGVEVRVVELPCGPAAAAVLFGELRFPPERTGRATELVIPVHRAQFLIPAPTGRHLVVLEANTPSEQGWPEVAELIVEIARSIRFSDVPSPTQVLLT